MNTAYGKLQSLEFKSKLQKQKDKIRRRKATKGHDLNEQEAPMKTS